MRVPLGIPVALRGVPVAVLLGIPVVVPLGTRVVVPLGVPVEDPRVTPVVVLRGAPVVGPQAVNDLRRPSPFVAPRVPPGLNGQQSAPDSRSRPKSCGTLDLGHAPDRFW